MPCGWTGWDGWGRDGSAPSNQRQTSQRQANHENLPETASTGMSAHPRTTSPDTVRQWNLSRVIPVGAPAKRSVRPALPFRLRPGDRRYLSATRSRRLPGVLAVPTLIKELPLPVRVLIGDFTDEPRILAALGLPAA